MSITASPSPLTLRRTISAAEVSTRAGAQITRRIAIIALALLLVTGVQVWSKPVQASSKPPNVLLIISDDQGWGDYSFMGHPTIRTPHIDRLAAQSLTFRRGYVPTSICHPSLVSMITGLYPHQHKITSNDPALPAGKSLPAAYQDPEFLARHAQMVSLIDRVPTLPAMLGQIGYRSFQSGKWWEGDYRRGGFTHGMTHGETSRGGRAGDEGLKIGRSGLTEIYDFIDAADTKPFFIWYAPMLPHDPHNPPARLLEYYKDKAPSLFVARYWAMCEWFDETCGELLAHLDRKGLAEDTIVIFLADNGWIQEESSLRFAARSKGTAYEGGVRTPILLRWPGKVKPEVREELASSIDLAPTILTAVGLKPTKQMQGVNLLDLEALQARRAVFGEIFNLGATSIGNPVGDLRVRWVIEGDWKLMWPTGDVARLYNLKVDSQENENVAAREAERVQRLKQLLNEWWPMTVP